MLSVELIQGPVRWATYQSDWNRLAGSQLTRSFEWLASWWAAYGDSYRLSILRVHQGNRTVAFFPLARHHTWAHGETICFLGSGKACSDDMSILCDVADAEASAKALAGYLLGSSSKVGRWDHMDLDGVRTHDQPMRLFLKSLTDQSRSKIAIETRPSLNCWKVETLHGWEPYLASLSKRVRKMWHDTERYLVDQSRFSIAQSRDESIEFAEKIANMHQSRWEQKGIVGCFGSERFDRFLTGAIESFWASSSHQSNCDSEGVEDEKSSFRSGRPLVGLLRIEGNPASGMIGFIYDKTLYVYLTGMNPEYLSFRPGWQTSFLGVKAACEFGCTAVDFMRGDEDYKPRLGALPSEQERWIIASPHLISQVRNKAYYTALGIRDWTQSWFAGT